MKNLMLSFVFLLCGSTALAAHKPLHAYIAFGEAYRMPSAARIGSGAWEVGMISYTFIGVQRIFDATPSVYSTFGFGLSQQGKSSPSVLGGVGWSYSLWAVQIRAELNAGASINMYSHGSALVGVAMGF